MTKKPDIEVTRPAEVNPTKVKPEMETKVKPDIDAAAASASAVPKVKAQEPDLPKAGQPEVTPDAGKKVQKPEEVDTEATKAGKVEEEDTNWGPDEISRLREDWGVPETDTLAIAKTDIEGLEDIVFKGGSPRVRKEAGLDDLDVLKPGGLFIWVVLYPEKQCPHHREHSPVRGEGSAEDTREYPPTLEVCDHAFDDDPVVIDVPVQVFLVVGEFSAG